MVFDCPFVYANGKRCPGKIIRVERYKVNAVWTPDENGNWSLGLYGGTHFHLFCSLKENHAGYKKNDDPRMKCWESDLPPAVQEMLTWPATIAPPGG